MYEFYERTPDVDSYWRGIVLFGQNVASYKFALAGALLELGLQNREMVPLDDLALPFARRIQEHLKHSERQATSSSSRFLDACRAANRGETSDEELQQITVRLGFNNVIDAFHRVGASDVPTRFFHDERRGTARGIRLTDQLHDLAITAHSGFAGEIESRWRLVETAWNTGIPVASLVVRYDEDAKTLFVGRDRRAAITGVRPALNGYQKGRCFYCFRDISITAGAFDLGQVDHFFPWAHRHHLDANIEGLWNLVLACAECNGWHAKSDALPILDYVARLHRRNEWLIASHLPLRETLISQTGASEPARGKFLDKCWHLLRDVGAPTWRASAVAPPVF